MEYIHKSRDVVKKNFTSLLRYPQVKYQYDFDRHFLKRQEV